MDFYQFENQDAIRFSWNNLPSSKVSAAKAVIPITAIYSPIKVNIHASITDPLLQYIGLGKLSLSRV